MKSTIFKSFQTTFVTIMMNAAGFFSLAFFLLILFSSTTDKQTFSKPHVATAAIWSFEKVAANKYKVQANHPPVVKITAPANNSTFTWDAPVSYSIKVSDKEDGESEYQEIKPEEVFLEVKYLANEKGIAYAKQPVKTDPPGLTVLKTSNCFNCHAFHAKSIGPSFYDISKRYPFSKPNLALLAKRIKDGSTGIWGTAKMPSHPELTTANVQSTVQWILKNAQQPGFDYYRGLEGSFRLAKPAGKQKGIYVLKASYTDHGSPDHPEQHLSGQDVIIVHGK